MHRRVSFAVAFAVVLAASAVGPLPAAQAASYTVWACADGQGNPLPTGDWSPSTVGAQVTASTTCGVQGLSTPGNLQAIAGAGPTQVDANINAAWNLTAPPGTKITGLDVWWSNSSSLQAPGRIQVYGGSRSLYMRDSGSFGSISTPFADTSLASCNNPAATGQMTCTGLSESTVALVAWCLVTCARTDRALSSLYNAYRTRVTITDDTAPTGEVSGLTDGQVVAGPVDIQARATDVGGGVADLQLVVDGRAVDSKLSGRASCQDIAPGQGDALEYSLVKPCLPQLPDAGPATFTLTPALLATAGAHNVSIVAHDAAGNTGTLSSNTVVVTPALLDGPAPATRYDGARNLFFNPDANTAAAAAPNGLNAGPAKMTLSFPLRRMVRVKGRLRRVTRFVRRLTVGYSTSVRMRARVIGVNGQPIVGARVYRAISVAGAPWRLSPNPLVTSKNGRVSIKMPARSPSRRVQIVYFPGSDSNASFRSPTVLLAVRAPVRLSFNRRVVPRGGRLRVTARLGAGRRSGESVIGFLQVRKGHSWQTVRRLTFRGTRRGGRGIARVVLRLGSVPRGTVFRFRALVDAQASLRHAKGASRVRRVRVR